MSEYRYILEKGSRKHQCPDCKKKAFVRYVDTGNSNNYLPSQYGRCDRESNCGYHQTPPLEEKEEKTESVIRQESDRIVFEFEYSKSLKEKVKAIMDSRWDKETKHWYIKTDSISHEIKEFAKENGFRIIERKPEHTPVPIPLEVLNKTLNGYDQNTFIQNLLTNVPFPFDTADVEKVISLYYLGTITKGFRKGGITFPFIDQENKVRAIQVKTFNKDNYTLKTGFLHRMLEAGYKNANKPLPEWLQGYLKNEPFVSCLFGAHLLKSFKTNPVALVEAPKSAVIGTLYFGFPETPSNLLWLGVYNLSSLKFYKCRVLEGRTVYLFPDLSKTGHAFSDWSKKAKEFEQALPGTRFIVSDMLEQIAPQTDKNKGNDLADYLIQLDWRKFRNEAAPLPPPEPKPAQIANKRTFREKCEGSKETFFSPALTSAKRLKPTAPPEQPPVETWDKEISALEKYFAGITLPTQPVKLDQCSTITNVSRFIESHLATAKEYNGIQSFEPCLNRLQTLKERLS